MDFIVLRRVRDVLVHIPGGREQVGAVSQRGHIHGVHGKHFSIHDVNGDMAQIEVFKLHGADVIRVRDVHFICVALAVRSRLRAVARLRGDRLGKDILLVEQHLKIILYLVNGELALMERR